VRKSLLTDDYSLASEPLSASPCFVADLEVQQGCEKVSIVHGDKSVKGLGVSLCGWERGCRDIEMS